MWLDVVTENQTDGEISKKKRVWEKVDIYLFIYLFI